MEDLLKYCAIIVIILFITFIFVLAYEFNEMNKDHKNWVITQR